MAVVETRGLTKSFGKHRGIVDLDLVVGQGETFGFLGPNGAGKTTTIRCLLGLLRPTSGEAWLLGERVTLDGAGVRGRIGYVPGEVVLHEKETGRWHIDHIASLRGGRGPGERRLIERLEFDPARRVSELSKGNRQKLALILALMHDPELLILDEPTSGLDPLNQEVVFDIISERVDAGATLFLSSHVLSEVERVCSRVGIIREGRLVADDSMRSLLSKRLKHLSVTFGEAVAPDVLSCLPGVSDVRVSGAATLCATVTTPAVGPVVRALATLDVRDLTIEHASLEDVFLEYYGAAPEGGDAS